MADQLIQIVDDNDQPLYGATKEEAIEKRLNRRIVRVMMEDGKGNLLLQKRGPNKRTYPNRWDNSVAGHVDEGETYEQAVVREISEEVGLHNLDLKEVGSFYVHDADEGELHAFIKAYKTTIGQTPTNLGRDEVSEVKWFSVPEIRRMIAEQPEIISDGLRQVMSRFYQ